MSEFIENSKANPTKQDCELNAFHRLAARLKERFPRLPICLSLDGLFACGPVFLRCHAYNWHYVIVLKQEGLSSVYHKFDGLAKLQLENKLSERIVKPAEIKRDFRWVNDIEYRDSKGNSHNLDVIELHETEIEKDQLQITRFMWLTDLEIDTGNVRAVAQNAGRDRWKIENQGFNSQKCGGFALEHLYSHDYTSAKVFYYLLQMAHLFFQLMVAGNLFKKYFPRGFGSLKNFAERLLEAWRNSLLHEHIFQLLDRLSIQLRFDTS